MMTSKRVHPLHLVGTACLSIGLAGCGGGGGGSGSGGDGAGSGSSSSSNASSSGFAWHAMGEGVFGTVYSAAMFNGELLIGGDFHSSGDVDLAGLAAWRDGGWQPFADHFSMPVNTLLVHEGALYSGGHSTDREELYGLIRIDPDGTITRLGDALQDGAVNAIEPFKGDLIVAGGFINIGLGLSCSIARWDGETYHELTDLGPNNAVFDLAVYKGDLYVAGWFRFHDSWEADARPINFIARWDGEKWHPVGEGLNESAYTLAVYNDRLYAGGDFTEAGGASARHIAAWDGQSWQAVGEGVDGPVRAMTTFNDGTGEALIVGGQFTSAGSGVDAGRIARWNGSAWSALGPGFDDEVMGIYAITEGPFAPALIAGGDFYMAGEKDVNRVAIWRKE